MIEKIHYEDNIFYLSLMIRNIDHSFKLHIDTDFFSERIIDDILFVDSTIQKIFSSLRDNTHLIKRNEFLHNLLKLKRDFALILKSFLKRDIELYPETRTFAPQIKRSLETHDQDIITIRAILKNKEDHLIQNDALSNDELNYLMTPVAPSDDDE